MVTVKQIQEASAGMSEEEINQLCEALQRELNRVGNLFEILNKAGMALQWSSDLHAYIVVDAETGEQESNERATALLEAVQQKKPPQVANVFHDRKAGVLTSLPYQAYPAAVIDKKDKWKEVESMKEHEVILAYERRKPRGTTSVQVRADATGLDRKIVLSNLRAQVEQLSDLNSDIFWAMMAQLQGGHRDEAGNTWITVTQLLNYRGIKQKEEKTPSGGIIRHGHRTEDNEEMSRGVRSMENTWIKLDEMEIIEMDDTDPERKKPRRSHISRESRLFMFGDIIYHQELSLDGTPGRKYPIAWQYRESTWALPFLTGPMRFEGTLIDKTLHYDPYRQLWEKRLSKYFMVYFRENAAKGYRPITIQELFDELNLPIDERNKIRTRDRFEKAMNAMVADDHISAWRYQEEVNPPVRNWLPTWLAYHIIVEPPGSVKEKYEAIRIQAAAARPRQSPRRRNKKMTAIQKKG